MRNSIGIDDLPFGALLKLSLVTNAGFWLPVGILVGVLGLLGFDAVKLQDEAVHGAQALIAGLVVGGIFTIGGTIIFGLGAAVLKLLSRFSVNIRLGLKHSVHVVDAGAAE